MDESVLTGEGLIRGRRVAVIVSEFRFLAGSIGLAAAERIVNAVERATREGLPLLAGPASGGTRMQEGTIAFLSMVKISAAVRAHRQAGLPYLVYLRHPTTGGVMASWGSLGHITAAEPGALLGFLGPRVYEALHGTPFPENVQTAENLFDKGLIDAVVPPGQLSDVVDRALSILVTGPHPPVAPPATLSVKPSDAGAWESIGISRNPRRPDVRQLLAHGARDVLPLNGTGQGEKDPGLQLALARFGQQSCVVIGHTRPRPTRPTGRDGGMGPGVPPGGPARHAPRRGTRAARWSPSSTPPARHCPKRPRKAAWPARSPGPCTTSSGSTPPRCPSCSARVPAAGHWPSCPRTGPSRPSTPGCLPCRPKAPAPSSTGARTSHRPCPRPRASTSHPCTPTDSWSTSWTNAPMPPRRRQAFCRRLGQAIEYELATLSSAGVNELLPRRLAKYRNLGSVLGALAETPVR